MNAGTAARTVTSVSPRPARAGRPSPGCRGARRTGRRCAPCRSALQARIGGDARVGGADVLAPPVVVHLVDAVDEDEARLGEVVGGRHDDVPHAPRRQGLVDLAGDQALVVDDVALVHRPFAPDELRRVGRDRACRPRTPSRDSGKASFHSRSSRTACMNSSVMSSDRLNCRRRPFSRLARMNSMTSGCPMSKVPICAPRRPPAEETVKHILSKISMNDSGPDV